MVCASGVSASVLHRRSRDLMSYKYLRILLHDPESVLHPLFRSVLPSKTMVYQFTAIAARRSCLTR